MKIPARKRQYGLRFNITPLIDIVFLLIIFFIATSHFVRSETLEPVELPEAGQTEENQAQVARRLVVTITGEHRLIVGARQVDREAVEAMIRAEGAESGSDFEVWIRSDKTVPYRMVEPILLTCARSGVTNVQFNVYAK